MSMVCHSSCNKIIKKKNYLLIKISSKLQRKQKQLSAPLKTGLMFDHEKSDIAFHRRVKHLHVAKYLMQSREAFLCWKNEEHLSTQFEILLYLNLTSLFPFFCHVLFSVFKCFE